MAFLVLFLMIVLFGGAFLFFYANPFGWIFIGIGVFCVAVWAVLRMLSVRRAATVTHTHGEEDRDRGAREDPMSR